MKSLRMRSIGFRKDVFLLPALLTFIFFRTAPAQAPEFLSIAGPSTAPMLTWSGIPAAARYELQVATDLSFTSIILDDSTIDNTLRIIGPLDSLRGYYCRVAGMTASGPGGWSAVLKFFAETGRDVFTLSEPAGWNLLSIPLDITDTARNFIFPGACGAPSLYCYGQGGYDCCGNYLQLAHYGFWNRSPEDRVLGITGIPSLSDTQNVVTGWNLIGSSIAPTAIDQIVTMPPGNLISRFFSYTGFAYTAAVSLQPFGGYWVRANGPGVILLPEPGDLRGSITAYVHWQNQPIENKKIVLVETGDTLYTDAQGLAKFTVPPGNYTVRAFEINRGGPALLSIDFKVEVSPFRTVIVDIIDCLPCF